MLTQPFRSAASFFLLAALLPAAGCAVQAEPGPQENEPGQTSEPVQAALACVHNGFIDTCPPAPQFVMSSTYANAAGAHFEVGPLPAGTEITVVAFGSNYPASVQATASWTCAPGKVCPAWSYYASGSFTASQIPNWKCGTSAILEAYESGSPQPVTATSMAGVPRTCN